jgi:hypothetical protein
VRCLMDVAGERSRSEQATRLRPLSQQERTVSWPYPPQLYVGITAEQAKRRTSIR